MSKITLEQIKEQLPAGWQVLSDKYINLDTEMDFKCNKGHLLHTTWKKLRDKFKCPICAQHSDDIIPIINKSGNVRILAIDQATYNSGWAIFDNNKYIASGVFTTSDKHEMARDLAIKKWLLSMIDKWKPDMVGIEDLQHEENGKTVRIGAIVLKTLAHLQGIMMLTCYENNITYHVCQASVWKSKIGIKSRVRVEQKAEIQKLVFQWYNKKVTDDEADAIGIGKYLTDLFCKPKITNWE